MKPAFLGKLDIPQLLDSKKLDAKTLFAVIFFCAVFVFLDCSFLVSKQIKALRAIRPQISKMKTDLESLDTGLGNMQALQKGMKRDAPIGKTKKIISDEEVPLMLQQISATANDNDIKVLQIRPIRESPLFRLEKPNVLIRLKPLLVNIDLSCDYHQLGKFLNRLEGGEFFLAVEEMKIAAQPQDYLRQRVTLLLKTYVKK